MELELKILAYWLFWVLILYIAAKIDYKTSDTGLNWKKFVEDSWFGAIYLLIRGIGLGMIAVYLIVKLTFWWFR